MIILLDDFRKYNFFNLKNITKRKLREALSKIGPKSMAD